MSTFRKEFNKTLKDTLNKYYLGWNNNKSILGIPDLSPESYRSLKENWTKKGGPRSSEEFTTFINALKKIPDKERQHIIELQSLARSRKPQKNPPTIVEGEYQGITWRVEIPKYATESQKALISTGVELFTQLVEGRGSYEIRQMPLSSRFGDNTYDTFKTALRAGAFRLTEVPRAKEKEEELKKLYPNLINAIVADVNPEIGGTLVRTEFVTFLAATQLLPNLRTNSIGMGGGYTLMRLSEQALPEDHQFGRISWVSLNNFPGDAVHAHSPNHIVSTLAHRYTSRNTLQPWSAIPLSAPEHQLENTQREYLKEFDHVRALLLSVNGPERGDNKIRAIEHEKDKESFQWRSADFQKISDYLPIIRNIEHDGLYNKIAGEVVGHILDDNGNILGDKYEAQIENVTSRVPLNRLTQVALRGRAIGIGARKYKARAFRMAIRKGILNEVVIDREIAQELLDWAKASEALKT